MGIGMASVLRIAWRAAVVTVALGVIGFIYRMGLLDVLRMRVIRRALRADV
jgi:hypothetical protein